MPRSCKNLINKKIHNAVSEMEAPKVGIKGVLAGHTVTMVTHNTFTNA